MEIKEVILRKTLTIKDFVIRILSVEKPLTSKQLFEKIVANHGREITIQALSKSLKELEENQIIEKNKDGYQLTKNWIEKVRIHSNAIDNPNSKINQSIKIPENLSIPFIVEFTDISSLCVTVAEWIASGAFTSGKAEANFCVIRHGWWPFKFRFKDFALLKRMEESTPGTINLILSNTPFDQWISKHYVEAGRKAIPFASISVCGAPFEEKLNYDFIVHGDVVLKAYFSPETNQLLDEVYEKISNLTDLFLFYATNKISEENVRIKVVIQRDPLLAKVLKEKVRNCINLKTSQN